MSAQASSVSAAPMIVHAAIMAGLFFVTGCCILGVLINAGLYRIALALEAKP